MTQPLIDIIDECIDRLSAGESIEDCVADYPAYADDLRDMLSIGALIGQLAPPSTEADLAHQRTRQQLTSRIEQEENRPMPGRMKKKRKRRTVGVFTLGTAAVLALIAGIGIGIVTMNLTSTPRSTQSDIPPDIAMTATAIINDITAQANAGTLATPVNLEATTVLSRFPLGNEYGGFTFHQSGLPNYRFDVRIIKTANTEQVVIRPSSAGNVSEIPSIPIDGWSISHNGSTVYSFEDADLSVNDFILFTGTGADSDNMRYMGETSPIWQLDDIFTLRDANGKSIVSEPVRFLIAELEAPIDSIQMTATQLVKEATIAADPRAIGTPVPLNPLDLTATHIINQVTATALSANEPEIDKYHLTATVVVAEITATAIVDSITATVEADLTATAQAAGIGGPPSGPQLDEYQITATAIVDELTATAEAANGSGDVDALLEEQREELAIIPSLCTVRNNRIVNLRQMPDLTAEVMIPLLPDNSLEVLEIVTEGPSAILWYRVRTSESEIGWLREDVVESVSECP